MEVRPKKHDLIAILESSITDMQWDIISKLRGQPIPATHTKKENLLNGLFKKTITKKHAKSKGRQLQQWVCQRISEFTGLPWGKDEEIASRAGGQPGTDVRLSLSARVMFPFSVECKSSDQWAIPSAIKQCKSNLYPGTDWLLVLDRPSAVKKNQVPPIIVIDGETFFKIITREGLCRK